MSGFGYDVLGFGSGAVAVPPEVDDEFNRVSFLSHFDGANNGVNNAFDDGSTNNHTVTANGNVTQGSFGPFARPDGEWSVAMRGDGGELVTCSPDPNAFGTADFTFECFLMILEPGIYQTLADSRAASTQGPQFDLYLNGANKLDLQVDSSMIFEGDTALEAGVWYHIAVCRSSSVTKAFINGTQTASGTDNTNYVAVSANRALLGGSSYSAYPNLFNGFISNLRVVKRALYTGNFTAPTSKLTAVSNTELLTFQSNRFVDNSSEGHTLVAAGTTTPTVSAFGPFLTDAAYDPAVNGASAYFDGTGDYLSTPSQGTLAASANWCMESYVFFTGTSSGTYRVMSSNLSTDSDAYFQMRIRLDKYNFYTDNVDSGLVGTAEYNQWTHMAMTKSGTTVRAFVNGIKLWEATDNGTTVIQNLIIGWGYGSEYFPGYISDARFVNGSSIYTANFTPPTAPTTAITNTSLLLNMAGGQAIDSAAQNNLTLYGNAKLSTGQAKFGDTSLALDGTGDFVHLNRRSDLSGPFTIETWAWADDTTNAFMWCQGQYKLEVGITGNTLRMYRTGSATEYTNFFTGGEFSVNTWHHVALVRDTSNVIKCYLNGTASGTTVTDATAFAATGGLFLIGGEYNNATSISNGWDGYLDDFRISDFALYASNFTAPTKPFPDQGQV